jgi:hypothetical protein
MIVGFGSGNDKGVANPGFLIDAMKTNTSCYSKLDGTKKELPKKIIGIQWNNKLNTTWTRQAPALPQFPFPAGYTENAGTCGVSKKTWDDISQKYYFKHNTSHEDIGDKTNQECAAACNNDDECYAFQNIHTIQPSPCKLFYEKVTEYGGNNDDANLDKAIKDNTSCYVKDNIFEIYHPKFSLKPHKFLHFQYIRQETETEAMLVLVLSKLYLIYCSIEYQ